MELPDWLRGIVLLGRDGAEYRVVGVDADGYLGVILQAAAEVTIPGDVNVTQDDSVREMQGADGATLRTVVVDANGQIIMVPRGVSGSYMAVDANGYLGAILKAKYAGETSTVQSDAAGNLIAIIKGLDGATSRNVAVDANGQIIMVPRGSTGNYMAVDANGYMGAILKATADVAVTGTAAVTQEDSVREMQGADGATLRTVVVDANGQIIMVPRGVSGSYMAVDANGYLGAILKAKYAGETSTVQSDAAGNLIAIIKGLDGATSRNVAVDANGQIIMVPRGSTGNYMAVDANGYMGAILKATADVAVTGTAAVTQEDSVREMQGAEGENLRTIAVDGAGQIIMVPRGSTGNYMAVDANGYMGAILKATADVAVTGTAAVTQEDSVRQMQGAEGENLRTIAVDGAGQIIMVPRGASGNYLGVDASGYMTTVMKGTYGATLKTLAADNEGYLVAILKDNTDQWGKKISVGLAELAARLGSPISWDRRGQVVQITTFEDGFAHCVTGGNGTGNLTELYAGAFQTGGYSCLLKTGTTAGRSASITTYSDYSPSGRLGFGFTFSMTDQPDDVYALGKVLNGVVETRAYMRWHKATNKLQILNSGNVYVDVCDFQLVALPTLFVSVKVVCDVSQQKWVRLLSRGVEYDISDTFLYQAVSATHPYLTYQIQANEGAAVSHTIYVDRMIVTTNEP